MTQYALRPVEFCDLPTLKRWRSLPHIQQHLRHPQTTWYEHLQWWWGIRSQAHPTRRVWAVVKDEVLVGQAGLYYRMGTGAEVSILVMDRDREDFVAEQAVMHTLLAEEAQKWGLTSLWAEVLTEAPFLRHFVFPLQHTIWADSYSTIYRWSIA